MILQPTLVLGVGGIGGRIISMLAEKLSPEDKKLIATLALDTNVNDLNTAINAGIDEWVQISEDYPVGEFISILEKSGNDPKEWFNTIPLIYDSSLLEGASQVRQKSRLALLAARHAGKLDKIADAVDRVNASFKGDMKTPINIIVVGSIAGGTCAGTMLQLPFVVRDILFKRGVTTHIKIRALFIGPNVTLGYQQGDDDMISTTFSNSYACIKEINALYRYANADKRTIPVRLECYEPERVAGGTGVNPIPYDYVFFIDKYRTSGQAIFPDSRPEDYEDMAVNVLLAQLSQVGSTAAGAEDNLIRNLVKTEGMSRFNGAGAYNIEYPIEGLIEYCAERCAADSIGNQWRRIDEDYKRESRAQKIRALENSSYEEEEPEDFYARKFEEYSGKESSDRFFKSLAYELQEEKTKPSEQEEKKAAIPGLKRSSSGDSNSIIDNAFKEIKQLIKNDSYDNEKVKSARRKCEAFKSETAIKEELLASKNIGAIIDSVRAYIRATENVMNLSYDTSGKIISIERLDPNGVTPLWIQNTKNYNIAYLIRDKHPIVARYVLVKLRSYMMAEIREDRKTEQKQGEELYIFDNKDFDGSKDGVQKAEDVASVVIKNMGGRSFGRRKSKTSAVDDFSLDLSTAVSEQLNKIDKYLNAAYKRRVFQDVLKKINALLKTYQLMFDSLPAVTKDISNKVMDLETLHNEENERVTRYAFGRGVHKRIAFEVVKSSTETTELSTLTKETFSESLYAYFAEFYSRSLEANAVAKRSLDERLKKNVQNLFEKKILPEIKTDVSGFIRERFDRGIINALRFEVLCDDLMSKYNDVEAVAFDLREALESIENLELTQDQEDKLKKILLEDVSLMAGPYVTTNITKPHEASYWGFNPDIASYGVSTGYVKNLLNLKDAQLVEDSSFSPNQIICYKILYGAQAHNLNSFNEQSEAYRLYNEMITDVLNDERKKLYRRDKVDAAFSPHIDKRWHEEAFLPDLNPEKEEENRFNDLLATAGILALGNAEITEYNGVYRWTTDAFTYAEEILIDGRLAPNSIYGLFSSMSHNQLLKNRIVERLKEAFKHDVEVETDIDSNILKHSIVTLFTGIPEVGPNAVDRDSNVTIFDIMAELKKSLGDEWFRDINEKFAAYIMKYCEDASTGRIGQPEKLFNDVMSELKSKSKPETRDFLR